MISKLLVYLILISFLIRTVRNILNQSFLWQLKEYRLDRIVAHLKTTSGRKLIFGPITIIKWICLFTILVSFNFQYLFGDFSTLAILIAYLFFYLIWIFEAIINLKELFTNGWKIPVFTFKSSFIVAVCLIFQFSSLLFVDKLTLLIIGPFLDKLLAPTLTLIVLLVKIPQIIYIKWLVTVARKKINSFTNLIVIGITGSYGKTSTKEFLSTLLSIKYKVVKTAGFNNTLIGVVQTIAKKLSGNTQVFVVEMGAYKKGEIKAIADLVKPKIGIITAISEQHIELFGSLENIMKTKYELIESLPVGNVAIFNGNNKDCLKMAKWAEANYKTLIYHDSINTKKIRVFKDHTDFTFIDKNFNLDVSVPLVGKQNIENLVASILAAKTLGMSNSQIQQGLSKITSPSQTMRIIKRSPKITIVDDTFNANSVGVEATLDYMKLYIGNKILILTPLIELGEQGSEIHEKLGYKAASICDIVALTNSNYKESFFKGASKASLLESKVRIVSPQLAVDIINANTENDSIALFEGKEAGKILRKLTS